MKESFMFVSIQLIRAIPRSTISFIATVGCVGLVLFLIAATVVLALIPVFISKKQATLNPGM